MLLPVHNDYAEPRKIRRAVEALLDGAVIAYPTDTVYGLGCDLTNRRAVDRLYQLKAMPRVNPLAFIFPDLADIARYAVIDKQAYRLLRKLLPGPYCFILPATREVPKLLQSKRKTVGIRVPAHPVPVALARELGRPLLTSSAGPHGEPALRDAREIDEAFAGLAMVLDGGLGGPLGATVLDLSAGGVELVREGAGPIDAIG